MISILERSRSALRRGPKMISKWDQFWKDLDQGHSFESDLDHSTDQDQSIDFYLLPKRSWSFPNPVGDNATSDNFVRRKRLSMALPLYRPRHSHNSRSISRSSICLFPVIMASGIGSRLMTLGWKGSALPTTCKWCQVAALFFFRNFRLSQKASKCRAAR